MTIPLKPLDAYRLWSRTWEKDVSAIVALESRWARLWLTNLHGKVMVDLGCGAGRWLAHAQAKGAVVYGFDLCREMLLEASRKPGLQGRLGLADAAHIPVASGCADIVLCALSLGHVTHFDSAVAQLAHIVRPGGCLIVTDFHPDALRRGWKRTFRSDGQLYEVETNPYTKERLIDSAGRSGLVLQDMLEPCFDEPEREIFRSAGKQELYEQVRGIPAVLLARWIRP